MYKLTASPTGERFFLDDLFAILPAVGGDGAFVNSQFYVSETPDQLAALVKFRKTQPHAIFVEVVDGNKVAVPPKPKPTPITWSHGNHMSR